MKTILTKLAKSIKDETGQAFILVLILLVVGSLILAPLLSYMGTGMKAGQIQGRRQKTILPLTVGWRMAYGR